MVARQGGPGGGGERRDEGRAGKAWTPMLVWPQGKKRRRKVDGEVSETVGSLKGKFGKASGESSVTIVCEVHVCQKLAYLCCCCAQSLAGSKLWEVWLRCKCRMGFRAQLWRLSTNYAPIGGDLGGIFSWSSYWSFR